MADDWWIRQGFQAVSQQNPDGTYTVKLPSGMFATVNRTPALGTGEAEYDIDRLLTVPSEADSFMQVPTSAGMDWPPAEWNIGLTVNPGLTPAVALGSQPRNLSVPAAQYSFDRDFVITVLGEIRLSEGLSSGTGALSPIRMGTSAAGGGDDFPVVRLEAMKVMRG